MTPTPTPAQVREARERVRAATIGGLDTDTLDGRFAARRITFADLRILLAALDGALADGERLDWFERMGPFVHHGDCRGEGNGRESFAEFRIEWEDDGWSRSERGSNIRAAIDAARAGEG